jgi:hypothetical protein
LGCTCKLPVQADSDERCDDASGDQPYPTGVEYVGYHGKYDRSPSGRAAHETRLAEMRQRPSNRCSHWKSSAAAAALSGRPLQTDCKRTAPDGPESTVCAIIASPAKSPLIDTFPDVPTRAVTAAVGDDDRGREVRARLLTTEEQVIRVTQGSLTYLSRTHSRTHGSSQPEGWYSSQ